MGSDALPFDGTTCGKRVSVLQAMRVDVARSKNRDDDVAARMRRDVYALLRQAWERGIEEVQFAGTIMRASEEVSTQMSKEVEVRDDNKRRWM